MADRLLLIDGMNLFFQMFFGMPSRIINSQGHAVQGSIGFMGALRKVMGIVKPTHIAVIFDGEHENPRTELDSSYKANRPDFSNLPDDQNPFTQLDDVYRALDCIGMVHFESSSCEADDLIASYAECARTCMDVVICSFDSDFFQLIGDNVRILRYRGERSVMCDISYLKEKFGIKGSQYVDYKSLTGDTADNIRGVDGIGPKTASALVNRFGSVEELCLRYGELESPRLRGLVENGLERLSLNKALIRMDRRVELPMEIGDFAFSGPGFTTKDVLGRIGLL